MAEQIESEVLINTCSVSRYSVSSMSETDGLPVKTWATVATAEPCRLLPTGEGKEIEVGKNIVISKWNCLFNPDFDIRERDRLTVDNQVFNVLYVFDPGGIEFVKIADLELVK